MALRPRFFTNLQVKIETHYTMLLKNIAIILSIIMVLGVSTASARPAVMDPLVEKTVKKNYKATSLETISSEGNGEA